MKIHVRIRIYCRKYVSITTCYIYIYYIKIITIILLLLSLSN